MMTGLIGKKLGMTQIFDHEGNMSSVTVVETGPCTVLALKDSPSKVLLGFTEVKESKVKKPQMGFFKKAGLKPQKIMKEVASTDNNEYKVGQEIKADFFKVGDFVDVTGISIGKGFQGGMKRWGWSGGPAAHGSMHHRRVGSIGASAYPSRVLKGTHMPGHMGARRITTQNLRVIKVDADQNLILVRGSVPGPRNGILLIRRSFKRAWESLEEKKAVAKVKRNPMKQSKAKAKGKGK